jgi:hypothetical protein
MHLLAASELARSCQSVPSLLVTLYRRLETVYVEHLRPGLTYMYRTFSQVRRILPKNGAIVLLPKIAQIAQVVRCCTARLSSPCDLKVRYQHMQFKRRCATLLHVCGKVVELHEAISVCSACHWYNLYLVTAGEVAWTRYSADVCGWDLGLDGWRSAMLHCRSVHRFRSVAA